LRHAPSLFAIVKSTDYSSVFARPIGSEKEEPSPTRAASTETLKSVASQAGRELLRFPRLTDIVSQRDLRSARNRRLGRRRSAVHVGNSGWQNRCRGSIAISVGSLAVFNSCSSWLCWVIFQISSLETLPVTGLSENLVFGAYRLCSPDASIRGSKNSSTARDF
jgi:hypothetical protein